MFWFSSRIQKQHVIPVFRGERRMCIEGYARPRKDRNLSSEAVGEEQSTRSLLLRREMGIHCSGPNLDSGLFRVIQFRSSTQAGDREKNGMTGLGVVCI